jgi:acetylornithine deacetylase/succinyl-diaminopimelate desuccinylase-like protein
MRVKFFAFLLLAIAAVLIAVSTATTRGTAEKGQRDTSPPAAPGITVGQVTNPPGTIDGAVHPEMIPDRSAYLMLFRLVANRRSEAEQHSIRSYLRSVAGLGRAEANRPFDNTDADIEAVIAAAEEFNERVTVLDGKAAEIKDRTWPNPAPGDLEQLSGLQRQKEALIDEMSLSLLRRLSPGGAASLVRHINQYVKRRVKLTPEPATLPGGPGWQPGMPPEMGELSSLPSPAGLKCLTLRT